MNESILCRALRDDVVNRLEENNSSSHIVQKKFEMIDNIARSLNIGEKFKAGYASFLYPLCQKTFDELYRLTPVAESFGTLTNKPDISLDDKLLILNVCNSYISNHFEKDTKNVLLNKTIKTLPFALEHAKEDKTKINVFYNKPKVEEVSFNKREIIEKFYSIPYGVCISFMGQIKTQIFTDRNFKSPEDEALRLDAMTYALNNLEPAKFMIYAMHFDKYIEKKTMIGAKFIKACNENVVPVVKNGTNKYLSSVGNMFGTDFIDYGSSGFAFKCLTSKFTPYNITRLCRIAEQIPSIDDQRFEKIRMDAIYISDVFENLRSYVHNQGKFAHRILKRMDAYYEVSQKPNSEKEILERKNSLVQAIDEINNADKGYNFEKEKYLDLDNYNKSILTDGKTEKVHEVLHRLYKNTTPKTIQTPHTPFPELNAYFDEINKHDQYPFHAHEVFGEYLGKLNNHLIQSIKKQEYGIPHELINTILWSERKAFNILENMDAGYQLGAFKYDWFKNIIMFYEITNSSSSGRFDEREFNAFFDGIKDYEMEDAYHKLSQRTACNIIDLTKKQRNGANKYVHYLDTLNLSPEQHKYINHKMQNITQMKIDSNMSGYRLSKAIFNLLSPRKCGYEALARYMQERQQKRWDPFMVTMQGKNIGY